MRQLSKFISENEILLNEWDFDNNKLSPNQITTGSNKKIWWLCKNGHHYQEFVFKKTKGKPCPYCTNRRVLIGYNDLKTLFPQLTQEWNYQKNQDLDINSFVIGSSKKVWWKCSKCDNEWQTEIRNRTKNNTGCPLCAIKNRIEKKIKTTIKKNGCLDDELLVKEWDYEKNAGLTPLDVTFASSKYIFWKCSKCGNSYSAKIGNRSILKRGCPYCSNKKVKEGFNDLKTTHPDLVKEWDYEKNKDINPSQITYGSGKKVWWICPIGHSYQATILHRTNGKTGCPICNSGRQTSFAEQALFYYLKKIHPDAINRFTSIFDNSMELDIYIPSLGIAIEYDGIYWHKNKIEREKRKYQICKKNNIKLIRIKENRKGFDAEEISDETYNAIDVDKNLNNLNNFIIQFISHFETFNLDYDKNGLDIDIIRDELKIRNYMIQIIKKSISELKPELAKEWHPTKNGNLKPTMFSMGSTQKVWWKCSKCNNEWMAAIYHRVKGTHCPKCYRTNNRGKHHPEAKVIYQYSKDNELIKKWDTIAEASKSLKINGSNISTCAKHQRNFAGGFKWEYILK